MKVLNDFVMIILKYYTVCMIVLQMVVYIFQSKLYQYIYEHSYLKIFYLWSVEGISHAISPSELCIEFVFIFVVLYILYLDNVETSLDRFRGWMLNVFLCFRIIAISFYWIFCDSNVNNLKLNTNLCEILHLFQ